MRRLAGIVPKSEISLYHGVIYETREKGEVAVDGPAREDATYVSTFEMVGTRDDFVEFVLSRSASGQDVLVRHTMPLDGMEEVEVTISATALSS